jgi:hypothetical protein
MCVEAAPAPTIFCGRVFTLLGQFFGEKIGIKKNVN